MLDILAVEKRKVEENHAIKQSNFLKSKNAFAVLPFTLKI